MQFTVALETDPARRREIHQQLTALLPEWFGLPAANLHYAMQSASLPAYVARQAGRPRGMLLFKQHSAISAEVYWLGVYPRWHRSGIGRMLVTTACEAARAAGVKVLFVRTLHPDVPYEPYERTRRFYEAMGFCYVLDEQRPDARNPLACYMKCLGG
jgi:GNAT superfamily N-acetyltransferase